LFEIGRLCSTVTTVLVLISGDPRTTTINHVRGLAIHSVVMTMMINITNSRTATTTPAALSVRMIITIFGHVLA
jgi:hypothetical protein